MESLAARAHSVTKILERAAGGGLRAEELLPFVYDELREIAERHMRAEPAGHTLQPTALVHEAYLRLVLAPEACFANRRHFFAAAAEAMRRILIERARRVQRVKRGGDRIRVDFDQVTVADEPKTTSLLDLDAALRKFESRHPQRAEVVKLRFFAGLSVAETAAALGLAEPTVHKYWRFARAWLSRALEDGSPTTEITAS